MRRSDFIAYEIRTCVLNGRLLENYGERRRAEWHGMGQRRAVKTRVKSTNNNILVVARSSSLIPRFPFTVPLQNLGYRSGCALNTYQEVQRSASPIKLAS